MEGTGKAMYQGRQNEKGEGEMPFTRCALQDMENPVSHSENILHGKMLIRTEM